MHSLVQKGHEGGSRECQAGQPHIVSPWQDYEVDASGNHVWMTEGE